MGWRLANALRVLWSEVDALRPGRDTSLDGTIGDVSHQGRRSDHNPDADGVVAALDITDDGGTLGRFLAEHLRQGRDPRIKYVISEGQMFSSYPTSSTPAWTWRPYSGINGHFSHTHISVNADSYDDTSPWGLLDDPKDDYMRRGDTGPDVQAWQHRLINWAGITHVTVDGERKEVVADGDFGAITEQATKRWQNMAGLSRTGVVNEMTSALLAYTRMSNELTEHVRDHHKPGVVNDHTHPQPAVPPHEHSGTVVVS